MNEWYERHHKANESPKFIVWWLGFYGHPDDYTKEDDSEYWIRRAFALMGFNAHKKLIEEEKDYAHQRD